MDFGLTEGQRMAFMEKGIRSFRVSRKWAAGLAVALVCTSSTSQRLTTSRAVNCFNTTPGSGLMSQVSTSIRVSWGLNLVLPGLTDGVGTPFVPLPGRHRELQGLFEHPTLLQVLEEPPHGGD